jgi:hypothetical protein
VVCRTARSVHSVQPYALSRRAVSLLHNAQPCRVLHVEQVSARRQGKVTTYDAGSMQISMEPWPRPSIHPAWAERAQAAGVDYYAYLDSMHELDEGGRAC